MAGLLAGRRDDETAGDRVGDGAGLAAVPGPWAPADAAPVSATLCPLSVTASTITTTAASTPAARAAPERKLISSIRA